jgi:hypothetical protein
MNWKMSFGYSKASNNRICKRGAVTPGGSKYADIDKHVSRRV